MERIPALGYLLSPLRKPTVIEKWSPYEVSLFESAIMLYGKNFHMIQQIVRVFVLCCLFSVGYLLCWW